jgi:polyhydroxyalkanoate synthesis regulator phasin
MALDALRAYYELASGLTEASRQRAKEVAQLLASSGGLDQAIGPIGKQAQQIAEDLIATSRTNRQLLMSLVRAEVDRGIAALGLPTRDEVERLQRRVTRLEQAVAAEGSPARKEAAAATRATRPTAKKAASRRATKKPAVRPTKTTADETRGSAASPSTDDVSPVTGA